MRIYVMILALVSIGLTSCNDGSTKELAQQQEELKKQNDSIIGTHERLTAKNNELKTAHNQVSQQLRGLEKLEDSTQLEKLTSIEAKIRDHGAMLASHREMIESHNELGQNFGELSSDAKKTQLSEMQKTHDRIMSEQKEMKSEHDNIEKQHQAIKDMIAKSTSEDESEG
ncbi:hypothetical protein [Salegentibacter salarius]|nr:hypothetical protein [Salegentibacter salarius]SLJ91879.1 hypothetical protein SAMN05660445_01197 [Salegentibacter salarius]